MNGMTENRAPGTTVGHNETRKSWLAHLPGILGGTAALLAALTTVYVNVRGGRSNVPVTLPASPQAAPAAAAVPAADATPSNGQIGLRLDRLLVRNDGSLGTTDWTFEVDVDGAAQFTLPMRSLSDREGENLVKPAHADQASAELELPAGKNLPLVVKGWKRAWLAGRSVPDIQGAGTLAAGTSTFTVEAKSDKAKGPEFVLYFSVAALSDRRR